MILGLKARNGYLQVWRPVGTSFGVSSLERAAYNDFDLYTRIKGAGKWVLTHSEHMILLMMLRSSTGEKL